MPDFPFDTANKIHLADAGRHDICHDMRLIHRRENGRRCVAEAQHAIAAAVINHCTFQGDHPGTCSCRGNVWIDCLDIVEVGESLLGFFDLVGLIKGQVFGVR